MEPSDGRGTPRNKGKQTQGKESTSGGSTQGRRIPANIKNRPSTQDETTNGHTEKANKGNGQGRTRRLSRRRKRPNGGFSVAASNQTEVLQQDNTREEIKEKTEASNSSEKTCTLSQKESEVSRERGGQNTQQNRGKAKKSVTVSRGEKTLLQKDAATVEEVQSQKEVKKQGQAVQQNKREARTTMTVRSSDSTLPQSIQPDCNTKRESERNGGTKIQGQTILQNKSIVVGSQGLQDGATGKDSKFHDGTRKQERSKPKGGLEAKKKVDVDRSQQELVGPHDSAAGRQIKHQDGTKKQGERIPQNRSKAKNNASVDHNDKTLSQDSFGDGATGKKSDSQYGTRKKEYEAPKNSRHAKKRAVVDRNDETMSQKDPQISSQGKLSNIPDGTKTEGQRIPQNRSEGKRSTDHDVDNNDKILSQDGATGQQRDNQHRTNKRGRLQPKNRSEANKKVVVSSKEKTLSQHSLQGGAAGKESNFQEGTAKQQKFKNGSGAKQSAVVGSKDKSTLPIKPHDSMTGKKSAVNNKDKTLPQNSLRNGTTGKECKSQDETRKQGGTFPDNGKKAEKNAAANGNNVLPRKVRELSERRFQSKGEAKKSVAVYSNELTGIESDSQVITRKLDESCQQTRNQSNKSVAVDTSNNALPQKDDATRKEGKSYNRTRKQDQQRRQNESKAKKSVAKDSTDSTLIQNSGDDCATELARKSQDGAQQGKTRPRKKGKGKKTVDVENNDKILRQNVLQDGKTRRESERQKDNVVFSKSNTGSQKSVQERSTGQQSKQSRTEVVRGDNETSTKRKKRKPIDKESKSKSSVSIEAWRDLLNSTPDKIVCWLKLEQSPLFVQQQNMTNDAVIVLMRLVRKACDCDSHAGLSQLFDVLQTSWFLTRRVAAMFDQLVVKKSRIPQAEGVNLDAIRDLVKLLTDVFSKFPDSCPSALLIKMQNALLTLVKSGKLLDKDVIFTIQEMKRLKKEENSASEQQTTRKHKPLRAGKF